jgi:gluconokinase
MPKLMNIPGLRSPHDKVGTLVYFGRMVDKIRLHAAGKLPADYIPNLGDGFDKVCAQFFALSYEAITERVKAGGTDEELLAWCFSNGRKVTDQDQHFFNEFLRKRGWNDSGSERLAQRKVESGFTTRDEIQTFFDYIDADEGRK